MRLFSVALLASSLTMSGAILLLWLVGNRLPHKVSATCRYYMGLLLLVGLLIPFRPSLPPPFELLPTASLLEAPEPAAPAGEWEPPPTVPLLEAPEPAAPAGEAARRPVAEAPGEGSPAVSVGIPNRSGGPAGRPPSEGRPVQGSSLLFAVWLGVASGFFAYHLRVYVRFASAVRRWGAATADAHILSAMRTAEQAMRIPCRKVAVQTSALVASPMLIGFRRPVILLPERRMTADELAHILRHELTHYRRGDMWLSLLRLLVMSMHWFNPFVYLLGRMLRTDCEASCDERVVSGRSVDGRRQYGETIIGFVGAQSTRAPRLSTYFYGGKADMKKRLFSIMDTGRKSRLWATACVTAVAVLTLLSGPAFASPAGAASYIGEADAKNIALTDAGLAEAELTFMKIELDYRTGTAEYDVELRYGQTKYNYKIQAVSGTIISRRQETQNVFVPAGYGGYTVGAAIGESAAAQKALDLVGSGSAVLSESKYKKDGRVEYKITVVSGDVVYKTEWYGDGTLKKLEQEVIAATGLNAAFYGGNAIGSEEAMRIALEQSGGGTVIKCKLDYKKEGLRYEVKIVNTGVEYKIKMDAATGAIYDYSYKFK